MTKHVDFPMEKANRRKQGVLLKNTIRSGISCQSRRLTTIQRLIPNQLEPAVETLHKEDFLFIYQRPNWCDVSATLRVNDETVQGGGLEINSETKTSRHAEA